MLSCMVALGVMCLVMPQESNWAGNVMHTPQLSQVLELETEETETETETEETEGTEETEETEEMKVDTAIYTDTLFVDSLSVSDTLAVPNMFVAPVATAGTVATVATDFDTTDTRKYLSSFYGSLKQAGTQAIRVVHYGDSQIEEDRLTTQLRRALQTRYGGGGVGLIPLHQTIPTRTIGQSIIMNGHTQQISQGPKRYLAYGPKSYRRTNSNYGPMGQVAIMDNQMVAGSEDIVLQINSTGKCKHIESYFNRIRIVKSGNIRVSTDQSTDCQGDIYTVPDSTTSVTIHLEGKGDIYGISLEKDRGLIVDNIPMRGCSGAVFTGCSPNEMQKYFKSTNTKLIILQFGGNIIPYTTTKQQVRQYIVKMQTQIQYLKYLAPNSSILFVGPSDMVERSNGQLQTYKMIPVMDCALQKMAIEEEIGYFSLYQHMGGYGSMITWKENGWAGGDYVHFTHKGADKAGEMLANWLLQTSKR